MHHARWRPLLWMAIGVFSAHLLAAAANGAVATVHLQSGRSFTAEVDSRTDQTTLWLRFGDESSKLLRPVKWTTVTAAEAEGRILSLAEFRQWVLENASVESPRDESRADLAAAQPSQLAEPKRFAYLAEAGKVRSIVIDACTANWDADVEQDGLIVTIAPIDEAGRFLPVDGTVLVELVGAISAKFHEIPHGRGFDVRVLGRWRARLEPSDLTPVGYQLRLPFQARHPQFNVETDEIGLVHVRLSAPGHGVFDASRDAIRIRPFAPLRDLRQRNDSSRFLPFEAVGRSRREANRP